MSFLKRETNQSETSYSEVLFDMTKKPTDGIDRLVCESIIGSTKDDSMDLADILRQVDGRNKSLPTYEQLCGSLSRLVASKLIAVTGNHRFFKFTHGESTKTFRGISESEFTEAVRTYRTRFSKESEETKNKLNSGLPRHSIVVQWKTVESRMPSDEDEQEASVLSVLLNKRLTQNGLKVNGWQIGRGQIDILMFAERPDAIVDRIDSIVLPIFSDHTCPTCSCIIRRYCDQRKTITSDVVP